jgi:hypothetical protein
MKNLIIIAFACIALMSFSGCAGMTEKISDGYEGIGIILDEVYDAASSACEDGLISEEDCTEIGEKYEEARKAYEETGAYLPTILELIDWLQEKVEEVDDDGE